MTVTKQFAAERLGAYLRHDISLAQLVDWAEQAVMDSEFDDLVTQDIVARLGVADVRAFGLTWEDCEGMLHSLGYDAKVQVVPA